MQSIERKEATPPRVINELLHNEAVNQFVYPDTRGPQEPITIPIADVFEASERGWLPIVPALVTISVFCLGVAVGRLL